VWSKDPESCAGSSFATSRVSMLDWSKLMIQTKRDTPNPKVLYVACLYPCRWGEWHMGNVSLTEPLGNRAASQSM
jgi:hypothetical protein